jgi:hypothetical protein
MHVQKLINEQIVVNNLTCETHDFGGVGNVTIITSYGPLILERHLQVNKRQQYVSYMIIFYKVSLLLFCCK